MSEYLLEMKKITKIYENGIVANSNINFNLKKGEIHALVGENGAGKTTLMKILFGMEKPSTGEIVLNGKEIQLSSSKDAIDYGIGMVHQHFMLINSFTVAQNITLGIEPVSGLFVNGDKAISYTNELSQKYNFKIDPNAKTDTLSVGVKQKIEILKSLARGAQILILDEPTAVLTPQETEQLFEELINLKNQGHTIIFISHKIIEVKRISNRITVMRAGLYEGTFNTADVSEQEISNKIIGWEVDTSINKVAIKKSETRIKIKNLFYHNGANVPIINDLSFMVKSGTVLGVVGVQGNGQVELIELITRNCEIERGTIEINGNNIAKLNQKQLRNTGFGYIPEDRLRQGVAKDASIKDTIISNSYDTKSFSKFGFMDMKKINKFAEDAIVQYKIKCTNANDKISSLSGGNMQKVVVARECSHHPKVLIAEQPTRGVDIGVAHIIHEKIIQMRDNGCAILLVSADLGEAMKICDYLLVMYEGEIVAFYEDLQGVSEEELGLCMLGVKKHTEAQIRKAYCE